MLETHAYKFFKMGEMLSDINAFKGMSSKELDKTIDGEAKGDFDGVLKGFRIFCKSVNLRHSVKGCERFLKANAATTLTYRDIVQAYNDLASRVDDELSSIYFFYVTQAGAQYYPSQTENYTKPLLSHRAIKKFPASIEDAEEAGKCFTLARYTACVFHLMRVMERGVQRLGKKLKVSIPVEEKDWGQISSHINAALKTLPNSTIKEKRIHARYAKAAVY